MREPAFPLAQTPSEEAFILLGRGGTGAAAEKELQAAADTLQARCSASVRIAFVDKMQPSLPDALDACALASRVVVVPVFAPDDPALRRWLQKVVMRWREQTASQQQIFFAPPMLSAPATADLLQEQVATAKREQLDVVAQVGEEWHQDPVGWSSVPVHQHHVLWCTGPRCTAKGAASLWPKLVAVVRNNPQLKRSVMPLQTSCQFPCNHGPMMIVYPQGHWYGPLEAADLEPVLTRHVLGENEAQTPCFHRLNACDVSWGVPSNQRGAGLAAGGIDSLL